MAEFLLILLISSRLLLLGTDAGPGEETLDKLWTFQWLLMVLGKSFHFSEFLFAGSPRSQHLLPT